MIILQLFCYAAILIFIAAFLYRVIRVATMPVHLRWELYPVPHEKGRAQYGGSKLEDPEWYNKEHKKDHFNELKEMGTEIAFLKAVWEFNRSLWIGSYPFHVGLYMMVVNIILLFIAGIFQASGNMVSADSVGLSSILYYLILIIAWCGSILGLFGSVRLMFSRLVDDGLRNHSSVSHYFNIVLIGGIFLTVFIWLVSGVEFVSNAAGFFAASVTFSSAPDLPAIAIWNIVLTAFFILYLPFTHMSHMYMKFFLYHSVRWEDGENVAGSSLSEKLGKQLAYPVAWSAAHIGADGKKNWGDLVGDLPEEM